MTDLWKTIPQVSKLLKVETLQPVEEATSSTAISMLLNIRQSLESTNETLRDSHQRYLDSLPADVAARMLLRIGLDSPQQEIRALALNCTCLVNAMSARQTQRFLKVDNLWEVTPLLTLSDITDEAETLRVTLLATAIRPIRLHNRLYLQDALASTDLIPTITRNIVHCDGQALAYPMLECLQRSIDVMNAIVGRAPSYAPSFAEAIPTMCRLLAGMEIPSMPQTSSIVLLVSTIILWFKAFHGCSKGHNVCWAYFPTGQLAQILTDSSNADCTEEQRSAIEMFRAVADMSNYAPVLVWEPLLRAIPARFRRLE